MANAEGFTPPHSSAPPGTRRQAARYWFPGNLRVDQHDLGRALYAVHRFERGRKSQCGATSAHRHAADRWARAGGGRHERDRNDCDGGSLQPCVGLRILGSDDRAHSSDGLAGWRRRSLIQTTNNQLNNHVLLVGGNNGSSTISAVYLFDPVQNAFSTLASIPSPPREQHFAAVLPNSNGKILVGGGLNGSQVLGSAIVFDPSVSNGTWSSAGTMTSLRVGASAVVLPTSIVANGSVIVAGGSATGSTPLSSAELFVLRHDPDRHPVDARSVAGRKPFSLGAT